MTVSLDNMRVTRADEPPKVQCAAVCAPGARRHRWKQYLLRTVGMCCIVFLVGEATARLDDQVRLGVSFWATPDHDRDLLIRTPDGIRGRPDGRFKKWRLNRFGFRGPDMALLPAPRTCRIMVLGASEMFGLYESPDKEVARQLADRLTRRGGYEVVNASIAGLTTESMIPYWKTYLARFRPRLVLIYASPLFYLAPHAPGLRQPRITRSTPARPAPPPPGAETLLARSRLLLRLKDQVHVPDYVQAWRTQREIAALTAGKGPDWLFHEVPKDRLAAYVRHMRELTTAIRASGSTPIILTHALRVGDPPSGDDGTCLEAMRVHLPQATPAIMVQFEQAARAGVLSMAKNEGIAALDLAAVMDGRRECFADLVHFTDVGAARVAEYLAGELPQHAVQ